MSPWWWWKQWRYYKNSLITLFAVSYSHMSKYFQKTQWLYTSGTIKLIYTHTRLTALFPGPPRWAGTRKVKPIWILLKQETVSGSGSGISWAICKSASRSRQITMPVPHHSNFFTRRMPFLPPNQQRQSTEGIKLIHWAYILAYLIIHVFFTFKFSV